MSTESYWGKCRARICR